MIIDPFQASVTPANAFPLMQSDSFLISPGHVTHVEISGERTRATSQLRATLEPEKRNCYFEDEYRLKVRLNRN